MKKGSRRLSRLSTTTLPGPIPWHSAAPQHTIASISATRPLNLTCTWRGTLSGRVFVSSDAAARDLLQDLSWVIPNAVEPRFRLEWRQADTAKWETLGEEIMKSQQDYEASKSGFWHKIWYGVGDAKDAIDPWVALIPSDYGLAIVKTGVAVLFKLAGRSMQQKQKIVGTFTELREILKKCHPSKTGFSDDPEVRNHADKLYQAVVDSIRDMLRVTTKRKRSMEMPRKIQELLGKEYVPRPPCPPDLDTILRRVTERAGEFRQAVSLARDEAIQRVDGTVQRVDGEVQAISVEVGLVHGSLKDTKKNTEKIIKVGDKIDRELALIRQENEEQTRIAREVARRLQDQVDSKNNLMGILMDQLRRELAAKDREIAELRARAAWQPRAVATAPPTALLSPDEFWALLAGRRERANFSALANQELSRVLVAARPDAVVVHFFCGLHAGPVDPEFGPNGLLRSVLMQLVLKLVELGGLNLGFVSDDEYVANLRSSDPRTACIALCDALCNLVAQFPAGTEVYCILDSISWFDREKTSHLLEIVMECLQCLVGDGGQAPIFKVFLTNSGRASLKLQSFPVFQQRPERLITLSPSNSTPVGLSPRAVERQIVRPSTPTPGTPRRGMSRLASGGGCHEDEHDHGFETE
ncbi:hypothetical protein MAPG_11139 [Magnaporthiopsis poae ATCC 64411]|uniref:Fungal STAND N-terminal Goodbye domain-containing protein n=1 Tax=Magnaporthiopsis poae (strain ATCC 64411 / 73-15) TaxID=644358 RepID=A0A0C4EEG6_MAGP6|nr:hypothetical protein MAPG_11139 [Magnaporthiopsis poae ATCC 64411]